MKIAIDIDEVLFEFIRSYMDFRKSKGYFFVDFLDVFDYDLENVFNDSFENIVKSMDEFYDSDFFDNGGFIDGAKESVNFLKEKYEIYFITSRPESWKNKTISFLRENFDIGEDRLFFSGNIHRGQGKSKEEICFDLGISIIIDDRGDHGIKFAESGLIVLMPDKPWNKKFEHKNIFRCEGWDEIIDKIEELDNGR